MERTRDLNLDLDLREATYGKDYQLWRPECSKILSQKFKNCDLTGLALVNYGNLVFQKPDPQPRQILFYVSLSDSAGRQQFMIKPSTMTEFEFGVLCFCANNKYKTLRSKAMLEFFEHIRENQPSKIEPRQISLIYSFLEKNSVSGVFCPNSKNKGNASILILSLLGENKTRAIPKNWGVKEIASYVLGSGDLPTPAKATEIVSREHGFLEPMV